MVDPRHQHTSDVPYSTCSYIHQCVGINTDTDHRNFVSLLLTEFKDVFPPELPPGLPPRRDVDHKIELTPGSKPIIRPTYCHECQRIRRTQ